MTKIGDESFGDRAGQMDAIHSFIVTAVPVSDEAAMLRDDFISYWDGLSFLDKTLPSQDVFDEMRNRQNQFWIANRPPEERDAAVKTVTDNRIDPRQTSGGVFPGDPRLKNVKDPHIANLQDQVNRAKPLLPSWAGPAIIGSAIVGIALGIAKVVSGLNPLALAQKLAKRG